MDEVVNTVVVADQPSGVRPCSVASALEIVGERWTLLAVRELHYGVHRFARIAACTGAPRDVLTNRLRTLEGHGIIERRQYSEHPPRSEYHLTESGRELAFVLLALRQWGDRWAVETPETEFVHECGQSLHMVPTCGHCGEPIVPGSLHAVARNEDTDPGGRA